jgi:hypothetical protein
VELFRGVNIDWLGKKWYFLAFSLIFSVAGILSLLFWHGLPLDVDFHGGTLVRVKFDQRPDVDRIRVATDKAGIHDARIQTYGPAQNNEVIIALSQRDTKESSLVGAALRNQALLATGYSLAGMLVYLWFRFELIYGVAAVVAVFHDTLITVGFFSLRRSGRRGESQHQPDSEPNRAHLGTHFPDRPVAVFVWWRGAASLFLRAGGRHPHRHLFFDRRGRADAGCVAAIPGAKRPYCSTSSRQKEPRLDAPHFSGFDKSLG